MKKKVYNIYRIVTTMNYRMYLSLSSVLISYFFLVPVFAIVMSVVYNITSSIPELLQYDEINYSLCVRYF
jgi:hypothetical protein